MKKLVSVVLTTIMTIASVAAFGGNMSAIEANAATDVSVYTGENISPSQSEVRPIAVMMPTDLAAQPSYGIGSASVLYEIMEEGNISRQMAIIDNWQNLDKIGNIRSCREYYIHIAAEWDPILIHFGGVVYMKERITAKDIDNISGAAEYGVGGKAHGSEFFFRTKDRKVPHNAYISADGIKKAAEKLGYSTSIRPEYYCNSHFAFTPAEMPNLLDQYPEAQSAVNIDLSNVFSYTKSSLDYNEVTGKYMKNIHGKAQIDGNTNEQISFDNVVVQFANWKKLDKKGYLSFDVVGSGEGYFCTRGKAIHCTWKKTSDHQPTKYYDDYGQEIVFNTGKTYIAVAQTGKEAKFQ